MNFIKRKYNNLGHVISKEGIAVDLEKVKVILEWIVPKDIDEIRSSVGL